MNSTILLIYNLFIILGIVSDQKKDFKPFSIKSGLIEYSYSGNKVGRGTLYFDDYGMKSALLTDAIEGGVKRTIWTVTSGNYQYLWNPSNPNKGMKLENPIINWIQSNSNGDIETFTESIYNKMGLEKIGTEIFLDKMCVVLKGKPGKVLIWNGIILLLDINVDGSLTHEEAIDIQVDTQVTTKHFIIPKNIKFSEMPGI